jgi:hypothetical protein
MQSSARVRGWRSAIIDSERGMYFFGAGILVGLLIGLAIEWAVDWSTFLPRRRPPGPDMAGNPVEDESPTQE